jgi:hypothetical protein
MRDSKNDILVVPLDKNSLPQIWRAETNITKNIESAVIAASMT